MSKVILSIQNDVEILLEDKFPEKKLSQATIENIAERVLDVLVANYYWETMEGLIEEAIGGNKSEHL
jgi:hypothetical protein